MVSADNPSNHLAEITYVMKNHLPILRAWGLINDLSFYKEHDILQIFEKEVERYNYTAQFW
jgi:hypothetical protein